VNDVLAELKQSGTAQKWASHMVSYSEFTEIVELDFHKRLDDRFGTMQS